jgi:sarcosine oxidase gamma subunit
MRRFVLALLFGPLLAFPAVGGAQNAAAPAKAAIEGSVVRAGTGEPIPRASVTLIKVTFSPGAVARTGTAPQPQPAPAPQQPVIIPAVTTDEKGKFQIKDIDPGTYRIAAARNGFAKQEYGQRSFNRAGTILTLQAGQQMQDVAFKLSAAPTISGRVIDTNGEAQPGITVQALRSTYDAAGKRTLQAVQSARTNDLGEYRLYWLNPGRYYVSANGAKSAFETLGSSLSQVASQAPTPADAQAMSQLSSIYGPGAPANEVAESGFALTYFPGTPEMSRAATIDLQPAAEVRVDFNLARNQRFRIRGRLVDTGTGRPPQTATVSVSPRGPSGDSAGLDALIGGSAGMLQGNQYNPVTGEFEVREVAEGSYWLQVMTMPPPTPAGAAGGAAPTTPIDAASIRSSIKRAQVPVDVSADVENIAVAVSSGITIPGRLRIEGTQPPGQNPYARLSLSLQPPGASIFTAALQGGGPVRITAPDGTFAVTRITPGDYKLAVTGMDPDMYIKDARLDRTDLLEGIAIADRVEGSIDITLSSKGGQVAGSLVDAAGKPVSGVQAVLVPDRLRNRNDLYKTAVTGADGHFTLRGITPGDYKIFAWEDIEPFSYFDADVLTSYEGRGKPVHIQEYSKETVEVKIIPVAQ